MDNDIAKSTVDHHYEAPDFVSKPTLHQYLDDCERLSANDHPVEPTQAQRAVGPSNRGYRMNAEVQRTDLPKFELPKFGGDTREYWSFTKQFDNQMEGRPIDDNQKLLYLMNYCYGDAKEAIRGCLILPVHEGYREARNLLRRLYGRNHVISRELIDDVLRFPKIQRYDHLALTNLFVKMTTCWKTLSQMNYLSDMNAMGTIQRIVGKFPFEMSDRWIQGTYLIYESGRARLSGFS